MYKVTNVDSFHYPHVVLELQDTTTGETKYWCYATLHDEELCREIGVKILKGCTLSELPSKGGWIEQKNITFL